MDKKAVGREMTLVEWCERLPPIHSARRELQDLIDALESWRVFDERFASSSYCEYCDSHADKNTDGILIAAVVHDIGCPIKLTRAALAKAAPNPSQEG